MPQNGLQGNSEYAIQFSFAETVVVLASSEIFDIVLFMVSYILITGYSILLFINPLNFICQRFLKNKKNVWKIKNVKNVKHVTKIKNVKRFTARCYASAIVAMVLCLSVCLSVTSRCFIKTAERIELVFRM